MSLPNNPTDQPATDPVATDPAVDLASTSSTAPLPGAEPTRREFMRSSVLAASVVLLPSLTLPAGQPPMDTLKPAGAVQALLTQVSGAVQSPSTRHSTH